MMSPIPLYEPRPSLSPLVLIVLAACTLSCPAQEPVEIPPGYILVDDMVLPSWFGGPEATFEATPWPGGIVPYAFDPNVTDRNQALAREAMDHWESVAGVTFVPRTTQPNYIRFLDSTQNASWVGMMGGMQTVWIANWDYVIWIIAHELGHALGFWHEHQRPDRDVYVTVNLNAIPSGGLVNYALHPASTAFGAYDFDSVMHYPPSLALTVNPPWNIEWLTQLWNDTHLSAGDIQGAQAIYGPPSTPNQALSLGVGAGCVSVPHHPRLLPRSGITVEAWISFVPSATGACRAIVRKGPYEPNTPYQLRLCSSGSQGIESLEWIIRTTGSGLVPVQASVTTHASDTWTHVAGTYDGTRARLYVDGRLVAEQPAVGDLVDQGGDELRIGEGTGLSGLIDEVRIWAFARSGAEIRSAAHRRLVRYPGLLAAWSFEGNLWDLSGHHLGQESGTVGFAGSPAPLSFLPVAAAQSFGTPAPATAAFCAQPSVGLGSIPEAGNADFALLCHDSPQDSVGVLVLSTARLPTSTPATSIQTWISLAPGHVVGFIPVASDVRGICRIPMPLPQNAAGAAAFGQFIWLDPCMPGGRSTSDAIAVVVQ